MQVQTQFLWLRKPVAIGDQVDGGRVSWIGGWNRLRVFCRDATAPMILLGVDTENSVRIENAGFRSVREIIIPSVMLPHAGQIH